MAERGVAVSGPVRRRLVAVVYGERSVASVSPVQLAEAAAGICELMWLVDARTPDIRELAELMRRFGPVVDIGDMDAVGAARAVGGYRPDGIVTYHDSDMVRVAAIAEHLRLLFVSEQTARRLADKVHQRQALHDAGISVPRFWPLTPTAATDVLETAARGISWPAVLKPRTGAGSRETFLARDEAHARALIGDLGSAQSEMMLEEYLPGDPEWSEEPFADYVSVESLVSDAVISHVAITGRFPTAETFRETGFVIPARLDAQHQRAVFGLASAAITALGVRTGCLHTEIKFTPDGPRILEVNGRIGYGVPAMLEQAAGFDMFAASLRVALGDPISVVGPIRCDQIGYRLFLQPPRIAGTVRAIDGVNRLADLQGVQSVTIHRGPGARVDWREGTRTFVLAAVGAALSHDEVFAVRRAMNEVVVSYN